MARAGIYFSDVKRARDALIARGRHPSIDAVRAELGDTGSKTTIHKFLREIESAESLQAQPLSEAIQSLVVRLAEQLRVEANVAVHAMRDELATIQSQHQLDLAGFETKFAESEHARDMAARQLESVQQQLAEVQQQLHEEQIARHTAEQRNTDLTERLADADRHGASLEDKHKQVREALEHFRTASREQREYEARRHEHQVQSLQAELRQEQHAVSLKQEQLTQLNKEAAGLAAELASAKQALYLEEENSRHLGRRIENLQALEARLAALKAQAEQVRARTADAETALKKATELNNELRQQKAALETALAAARTADALEEQIVALQRAVFGEQTGPAIPTSATKHV